MMTPEVRANVDRLQARRRAIQEKADKMSYEIKCLEMMAEAWEQGMEKRKSRMELSLAFRIKRRLLNFFADR